MATPSSILAWKIPWIEEPGELQSMGLQSRTQLSDFTSWYRKLIGIENILIFVHYLLSSLFHCFIDCFGFSK